MRSRIKAGTKALCIHFGFNLDSAEAGLSLPGFLLLEHPQTLHSLKSVRCGKLPHPNAFTQAPTCYLYFCDHFADIALLERPLFQNEMKKCCVSNSRLPDLSPRCPGFSGLPSKVQVPWRWRLSWRSSDRCLLRTGALLRSAFDRWRLGDGALPHSLTLPMYSLAVIQTGIVESSTSLQASLPRL